MNVLVIYSSRHGATRGIAERIGEVLGAEGLSVTVADAKSAPEPRSADAFVIGGAAYMGKWLDETEGFVRRYHDAIVVRPTWLFSSGPVGDEVVDKKGHDLLAPPPFLSRAAQSVAARGIRVFFGRWDPADPPVTMAERLFLKLPVSRELLPIGDFRDWPAIDAWAREIAQELAKEPAAV